MASGKITVAIEAAIHKGLQDFARDILSEHGVRIDSAEFVWIDTASLDGRETSQLSGVFIKSHSEAT